MRDIYERLGIGGFAQAEGKMRDFLGDRSDHRVSSYRLPQAVARKVSDRLKPYIDRFGYREAVDAALSAEPKAASPARSLS
jgi:hypothetical protein